VQPGGKLVPQNDFWEGIMKLPRRQFLNLATGAATLPAVSRVAWAQDYLDVGALAGLVSLDDVVGPSRHNIIPFSKWNRIAGGRN
jgi:hypothetical protein